MRTDANINREVISKVFNCFHILFSVFINGKLNEKRYDKIFTRLELDDEHLNGIVSFLNRLGQDMTISGSLNLAILLHITYFEVATDLGGYTCTN